MLFEDDLSLECCLKGVDRGLSVFEGGLSVV